MAQHSAAWRDMVRCEPTWPGLVQLVLLPRSVAALGQPNAATAAASNKTGTTSASRAQRTEQLARTWLQRFETRGCQDTRVGFFDEIVVRGALLPLRGGERNHVAGVAA
jgi:hypothetical protein